MGNSSSARAYPSCTRLNFSQENWLETDDELESFMDTFRTPFWTSERRWFGRCYVQNHHFHVQTLSKGNFLCYRPFPRLFQSTGPHDSLAKCFDHSFPADVRFPRLEYLSLKFPIAEHFWQVVPNVRATAKPVSSFVRILSLPDSFKPSSTERRGYAPCISITTHPNRWTYYCCN